MASPFELVSVSSNFTSGAPVPVSDAVLGTTADTGLTASLYGQLKRTQYKTQAAGTTFILSTAAHIERLVIVPVSSAGGAVTLSDGTTAILSIPAGSHSQNAYSIPLGITNTSTAGFKLVLGASVSAIVVGGFAGAVRAR